MRIGQRALNKAKDNPVNTIYAMKRHIGSKMKDEKLKADRAHMPFELQAGPHDKPLVVVEHNGEQMKLHIEEISAMILVKMRDIAEVYTGEKPIKDAVITVPAYFNNDQRQATINAGKIAGLNVLKVINEPTAAAIAYGLDHQRDQLQTILVYDFGGGTLDCTLLTIENGKFEVKASDGDCNLGGEDFDNALVGYCCAKFEEETNIDITKSARSMRRLRAQCENAKHQLSYATKVELIVENLAHEKDFEIEISRAKFEEICIHIFMQCLGPVESVLAEGKIDRVAVDDIVLVGGSTRIPYVQKLLENFFKKRLTYRVNPDEAVAEGATLLAAQLTDLGIGKVEPCFLTDFAIGDRSTHALQLQIECEGRGIDMSCIIPKNAKIPCEVCQYYVTGEDNQTLIEISVYQGDSAYSYENKQIDHFTMPIDPRPAYEPERFKVIFEYDENNILRVTVEENVAGGKIEMRTINCNNAQMSATEIQIAQERMRLFVEQGQYAQQKVKAMNDYETYLININHFIQNH